MMTLVSPATPTRDDEDSLATDSPSTAIVSPVSPSQQPSHLDRDANLPEVYVDPSPQAILHNHHNQKSTGPPSGYAPYDKYSVPTDDDTLKSTVPEEYGSEASKRSPPPPDPARHEKILGLKRRTFFILLAILLIIVAAAVGGGVGGAIATSATSNSSSDGDDEESAWERASKTAHREAPSSTASSASSEPTNIEFLNNQTDPSPSKSFAFQGFTQPNFEGEATSIIRERDGSNLNLTAVSYVWRPNESHCCISFCNSRKDKRPDWVCDERYRKKSSESFKRIFVWCGQERLMENSRCDEL